MTSCRSRRRIGVAVFTAGLCGSGCVSTEFESRDWSDYSGPGAEYFQAEEIEFPHADDPLEPLNRGTAFANYVLLQWVLPPFSKAYRFFFPEPLRVHLAKAGENLLFPTRFLNNLLQGKFEESGIEASRFVINSTVGVLGFFDPAQEWGMHPYPEDFGQTLAQWGWESSTFLVLPFFGASTVRDGLGLVPDTLTDPATYFSPATYVREFTSTSNTIEEDLRVIESTYDAYEAGRTLYSLQRQVDVTDFEWHADDSGATQSLNAIFLEPEEEGFVQRARRRRAPADSAGRELPFNLWLQPEPAPLLYVIPGFGGHRFSPSALALAEIGFANGHSVVTVSSPTNWEFMRHAASVPVPGFGPVDAYDLHVALSAIDADLALQHPGQFQERRIVGMSMGAHEALLMAAERDRSLVGEARADLIEFDLYLALNPPISIEHALKQLDGYYNAPLEFAPEERAARIEEIFGKVLYLSHGDLQPGIALPFTELESSFLIGLAFRLDLQFLILQSRALEDSGVLLTPATTWQRAPAFREAAEYSYMEYAYAFLLPYYAKHADGIGFSEDGMRRLFEQSDLRAAGEELRENSRVRVLTNEKDFLLRAEDMTWLRETLGDRLTLFEEGGHLGSLYRESMRAAIGTTLQAGGSRQMQL